LAFFSSYFNIKSLRGGKEKMEKKLVGILVMTLLIATALLPAVSSLKINKENANLSALSPDVEWDYTFGGDEFDILLDITQTDDGGYIACGTTEESDMHYVWLLKLDSSGNEEWRIINHDLNASIMTTTDFQVSAFYVLPTNDGGYLVAGHGITDVIVGGETVWVQVGYLWKVDDNGNTEWLKHNYCDEEELWVHYHWHTIEIEDGYIVGGWRIYFNMMGEVTNMDGMLMKTDKQGVVQWEKTYDAGGEERPCSLCPTSDGGYLLTGYTTNNDAVEDGGLFMIKTDSEGNKQWDKIFDGPGFEYSNVRYSCQTSDGGYLMCGNTASYGAGRVDIWIIKTDSTGNKVWDKTFGGSGNDYTWSFDATSDGGYVFGVAKDYGGFTGTKDDIWIVKTDEDGNADWKYQLERDDTQCTRDICQTNDGGYIVVAATSTMNNPSGDAYIVKFGAFDNQRPNKPDKPLGPSSGKPDTEYTFAATATDPDGDEIDHYMWDWGDGTYSDWLDTDDATHSWSTEDTFNIRVKVMDTEGGESDWSDPLSFSTPRNKIFLFRFLQRFPRIYQLINKLRI
jgi:hypothetical protein